jgi:hypothetical protein
MLVILVRDKPSFSSDNNSIIIYENLPGEIDRLLHVHLAHVWVKEFLARDCAIPMIL